MVNQKTTALVVAGWSFYVLYALFWIFLASQESGSKMLITAIDFIFAPVIWLNIKWR